jgi:translation elongation factor EF-4
MNQATESLTNYYESSLKNYTASGSPRTSINANYSSVSMNYTFSDATAGNIRSMDILISPQSSDRTYLVTYRDEASKFEKDLPELQKIIDSIKFSK